MSEEDKPDKGQRLDQARERVQETVGKARDRWREASASGREHYDVAVEQLRDGYSKVRQDYDGWSDDLTDYVRDNPGKSVMIAAGVGFVIGLLLRTRDEA